MPVEGSRRIAGRAGVSTELWVIDHAGPLRLLAEAGFAGYFSVEVIHQRQKPHDAEGVMQQYAEGFREITARM